MRRCVFTSQISVCLSDWTASWLPSWLIAALRTPFEQARKAENAGKHVFAGLREGRFATEGAGALLLAACMCGLEGSFNSEFRLDDVLSVIV